MKQVFTVSCKLQVTTEQVAKLDDLLKVFADACEYVNGTVKEGLTNELAMQSLVYKDVRARFGLSSQLTIHAIRRVAGNRKTAKLLGKPVKGFAPTSATYDLRTFSFREEDWTVSLTMLGKRERLPLTIGNYQRGLLKGQNPKTATLVKRRDASFYLNIQLESIREKPQETDRVLGIDLGRTDIYFTSEGDSYSGEQITKIRDKYSNLRSSLQQKAARGTRSSRRRCRRLLQRLSGKERRFQSHVNHTISYRLVLYARANQQVIALEELTGIRERTNKLPRSKTERRRSNSWSFYQLRQYLNYKSIKFGVKLILVNPAYTSKTCHCCGVIGNRNGKHFRCLNLACGWVGDSDLNGSKNISAIGQLINLPGGTSTLFCSLQDVVLRATENPTLSRQAG
ncbi:MAG: IS200/IS605 family element transposase accessory protein TnpB [Rivularia sp. T60_A2020_040]|nr:IS200/IS605 family element transposase accessory protein TnpB [Rivularia sp. T60_A2020_040]